MTRIAWWQQLLVNLTATYNREVWREGTDLGHPPSRLILYKKKSLEWICPLGANFHQEFEICAILIYVSPHFYTHNVEILLKRTEKGLRSPSTTQNCVKIAQRGCRYCIAYRRWCILISIDWYWIVAFIFADIYNVLDLVLYAVCRVLTVSFLLGEVESARYDRVTVAYTSAAHLCTARLFYTICLSLI